MKRTKSLLTLEELWELEDRHPMSESRPAGLMRWMYATGMFNGRSNFQDLVGRFRNGKAKRRGKKSL